MTKKILLGLFILLMGAVSFIAYNFYKNVKEPVSKTAFEAIPQNAALIIKESNFNALVKKINSTNIIWEELTSNTTTGQDISTHINYLDSILQKAFKTSLKSKEVLASIHLSGANSYDFIFYLSAPTIETSDLIQKIKSATKKNPSSRDYDGVAIYTFPLNENKIALMHYKNTIAFSYSTVLIEDVIRQLNNESSLLTDSTFAQVIRTSGQSSDGNIFVQHQYLAKVTNQYLNKWAKNYSLNLNSYAKWTELDINIKPNSFALNGFSFADDKNVVSLFKNQKPQGIDMIDILPYNTAFLCHYGLSNTELFFSNRKALLKSKNEFFNYQKYLDEQTENYGIDLEVELIGNIGNEMAALVTESQNEDFTDNRYIIFKVNEIDKTSETLKNIATKTNDEPAEPILLFNEHAIYKIGLKNVFEKLLGKPFANLNNHYYTFVNDYLVFGNSESALKTFITNISNNKTLSNNDNFKAFNDELSSSSNLFVYNNIARSVNLYKTVSSEDYLDIFDEKLETFRKFEAIAYQLNAEKNSLYYNNIYLKYNPVYKQETASLWELALDTITSQSPQVITNHKTGAKEIIVQDDANKLYLISNTGKIVWTKKLSEKVESKYHQIDVYKNNKLQLLFNTKSKIYLLDRNGNNVESYPIKLPAQATNGVTPIDYDKSRDYRILVGCMDNMVYNYDITGKQVEGWKYQSAVSYAHSNIWHFAISGKDYIVVPLKNGQVKIVERAGNDRIKLDKMLPINDNIYLKVGSSIAKTYLITADSNSTVVKLYFNDKKEALNINDAPKNAFFNFEDFNSDKANDYIFAANGNIFISNNEKTELYKNELEQSISNTPIIFNVGNHKLGYVAQNQIYLINNEGILEDGFPLAGSTNFGIADINNDQLLNLVVAHQNMIYTYNLK